MGRHVETSWLRMPLRWSKNIYGNSAGIIGRYDGTIASDSYTDEATNIRDDFRLFKATLNFILQMISGIL